MGLLDDVLSSTDAATRLTNPQIEFDFVGKHIDPVLISLPINPAARIVCLLIGLRSRINIQLQLNMFTHPHPLKSTEHVWVKRK